MINFPIRKITKIQGVYSLYFLIKDLRMSIASNKVLLIKKLAPNDKAR